MWTVTHLVAKLDYPPAPVMMLATLACAAFIFVGGYWFKRADEKAKAEREALRASLTGAKNGKPTTP